MEASASQIVGSFTTVTRSVPGSFERTQQRTVENIVRVPVSQIQDQFVEGVKEIHQERLPERIEELIEDTPAPLNTSSTSTSSTSPGISSATQVPALEEMAHALEPSPAELSALESLQNVVHEKQMEVDRCVLVLKREKKLRLLEECSLVHPREIEEVRRHIQARKDVMATAVRDLQACLEQLGLRLKREADVKTAQRAECFDISSAPSSPAVKKAKKSRHQK